MGSSSHPTSLSTTGSPGAEAVKRAVFGENPPRALGAQGIHVAHVLIDGAIDAVFASGRMRPFELGGKDGTAAIRDAVLSNL